MKQTISRYLMFVGFHVLARQAVKGLLFSNTEAHRRYLVYLENQLDRERDLYGRMHPETPLTTDEEARTSPGR